MNPWRFVLIGMGVLFSAATIFTLYALVTQWNELELFGKIFYLGWLVIDASCVGFFYRMAEDEK